MSTTDHGLNEGSRRGLTPSSTLLRIFGLDRGALAAAEDLSAVSIEAAEKAVERSQVSVAVP